jgi:hypothetical protein
MNFNLEGEGITDGCDEGKSPLPPNNYLPPLMDFKSKKYTPEEIAPYFLGGSLRDSIVPRSTLCYYWCKLAHLSLPRGLGRYAMDETKVVLVNGLSYSLGL